MVHFGLTLQEARKKHIEVLPPDIFVDYDRLKELVDGDGKTHRDFFVEWNAELQRVHGVITTLLMEKEATKSGCGPFRVTCPLGQELAAALLDSIEVNRSGFRKIVKKYDKHHKGQDSQQATRTKQFATLMDPKLEEINTLNVDRRPLVRWKNPIIGSTALFVACIVALILVITEASNLRVALVLGLIASFMTAWANAANDICNSVGTAFGAGAFSLNQAVILGAICEVIGCVSLGPFMSKSIVKGILNTDDFVTQPNVYAYGMVCVLCGAGSTTLGATFYGLPISATHGIIGGLIAVGIAANGVDSVGWSRVYMTMLGWVGAPLAGGTVSVIVYAIVHNGIYRSADPVKRSKYMQPLFAWICFSVNILFVLLKGPKALKVKVVWLAIVMAIGIGIGCLPIFFGIQFLVHKISASRQAGSNPVKAFKEKDIEEAEQQQEQNKNDAVDTFRPAPAIAWDEPPAPLATLPSDPPSKVESYSEMHTEDSECVRNEAEKYFKPLLIMSALSVAIAHGGNDVGNSIGPLSAIIMVVDSGKVSGTPDIPFWTVAYGSLGFVLGIFTMGSLTIKTVGTKITALSMSHSFAIQMGGAVAVLGSSSAGLPVSTSHCLVGSVVGIGCYEMMVGIGTVNCKVLKKIALGWGVTIPLAMGVALLMFVPLKDNFK